MACGKSPLCSLASLTFMDETAALVMVLCQFIHPFFHGMIWQAFEFLCLDHDLDTSHLTGVGQQQLSP